MDAISYAVLTRAEISELNGSLTRHTKPGTTWHALLLLVVEVVVPEVAPGCYATGLHYTGMEGRVLEWFNQIKHNRCWVCNEQSVCLKEEFRGTWTCTARDMLVCARGMAGFMAPHLKHFPTAFRCPITHGRVSRALASQLEHRGCCSVYGIISSSLSSGISTS